MYTWLHHLLHRTTDVKETSPEVVEDTAVWEVEWTPDTPPTQMLYAESRAAAGTNTGRLRENNEDMALCAPERGLFMVADGMGGHVAGERASAEAVRALDTLLNAAMLAQIHSADDARQLLYTALQQANDAVRAVSEANPELTGMGTTIVACLLRGDQLTVANLGDSRAYLLRALTPTILTRDHSVAAMMQEKGELTPEAARSHRLRNQLTASLGITRTVDPHVQTITLLEGDRIVLCSDGLWDMLADEEICRLATAGETPESSVHALIIAANEAGGLDNITVVLFDYPPEERANPVA